MLINFVFKFNFGQIRVRLYAVKSDQYPIRVDFTRFNEETFPETAFQQNKEQIHYYKIRYFVP